MKYLHQIKSLRFPPLLLASNSQRRAEILNQLRIPFILHPTNIEEKSTYTKPHEIVCDIAKQKAVAGLLSYIKEYSKNLQQSLLHTSTTKSQSNHLLVLGGDTIVFCKNKVYGKPSSKKDAILMLENLSACTHTVFSGIHLLKYKITPNTSEQAITQNIVTQISHWDKAKVSFRNISKTEISTYIKNEQWQNFAGAYGIQGLGACFIKKIKGLHSTVMGLPISGIYDTINSIVD